MISEWLISMVYGVVNFVVILLDIPVISTDNYNALKAFIDTITTNTEFVWFFIPYDLTIVLVPLFLATAYGYITYLVVMWVIKKIPMLGVS